MTNAEAVLGICLGAGLSLNEEARCIRNSMKKSDAVSGLYGIQHQTTMDSVFASQSLEAFHNPEKH